MLESNLKDRISEDVNISNIDYIEVLNICYELENLCLKEKISGISAIEIGIPKKIAVITDAIESFDYFINLDYYYIKLETIISLEKCLSIRSSNGQLRYFKVPRYKEICVQGFKLNHKSILSLDKIDLKLKDNQSCIFQNVIDCQKGITINQIGEELFLW